MGPTAIPRKRHDAYFASQAAPALPQLARGSIAAVKGLGNGLTRSQDQAASQARQWLQSLFEDGRKQAAISKESLEVSFALCCTSHPRQQKR